MVGQFDRSVSCRLNLHLQVENSIPVEKSRVEESRSCSLDSLSPLFGLSTARLLDFLSLSFVFYDIPASFVNSQFEKSTVKVPRTSARSQSPRFDSSTVRLQDFLTLSFVFYDIPASFVEFQVQKPRVAHTSRRCGWGCMRLLGIRIRLSPFRHGTISMARGADRSCKRNAHPTSASAPALSPKLVNRHRDHFYQWRIHPDKERWDVRAALDFLTLPFVFSVHLPRALLTPTKLAYRGRFVKRQEVPIRVSPSTFFSAANFVGGAPAAAGETLALRLADTTLAFAAGLAYFLFSPAWTRQATSHVDSVGSRVQGSTRVRSLR